MNNLILGIILLILSGLGVIVKSALNYRPTVEVKRLAQTGYKPAERSYKLLAYGSSTKVVLWTYISLTLASGFVLISKSLVLGVSIAVVFIVSLILFALIPRLPADNVVYSAVLFGSTAILAKTVYYLHPTLNRIKTFVSPWFGPVNHSGLYETEDLIKLMNKQLSQPDSRITKEEVSSLIKALNFQSKKVSDILQKPASVKTVLSDDVIGPILINEIHESGQSYVLVQDKSSKQIVGILSFDDLNIKSAGYVSDFMSSDVLFINENDSLSEALAVLLKAKQHVLVAVNNFEEYVGIVNTKDILKELVGELKTQEALDYNSAAAIAAKFSKDEDNEAPTQVTSEVIE